MEIYSFFQLVNLKQKNKQEYHDYYGPLPMIITESHSSAMEEGGVKNNPKYTGNTSNCGTCPSRVLAWT